MIRRISNKRFVENECMRNKNALSSLFLCPINQNFILILSQMWNKVEIDSFQMEGLWVVDFGKTYVPQDFACYQLSKSLQDNEQ